MQIPFSLQGITQLTQYSTIYEDWVSFCPLQMCWVLQLCSEQASMLQAGSEPLHSIRNVGTDWILIWLWHLSRSGETNFPPNPIQGVYFVTAMFTYNPCDSCLLWHGAKHMQLAHMWPFVPKQMHIEEGATIKPIYLNVNIIISSS